MRHALASREQRNATTSATSSGLASRLMIELGRPLSMKARFEKGAKFSLRVMSELKNRGEMPGIISPLRLAACIRPTGAPERPAVYPTHSRN
jgi:hypothetical protein